MSQNQGIIDYLKREYEAKTIFLYGSNASDKATPASDFDIIVISDTDKPGGREIVGGKYLDITVINELPENYVMRGLYAPFDPLVALYDETDEAPEVIKATKAAYKEGPEPLSKFQLDNRKIRLKKTIEKLEHIEKEELVFYYVGLIFSDMLLRYWFELKQRWP
ncbi:MAG TPA: nucleotidyltransferase domain-containing protein [Candidatus Saccharimonadales bacterium]